MPDALISLSGDILQFMTIADLAIPTIGVIGTIAGAALVGGLNLHREKVVAGREQQKQWRGERLKAYVALLRSTSDQISKGPEWAQITTSMFAAYREGAPTPELQEQQRVLEQADLTAQQALAEAELLASAPVSQAARHLAESIGQYYSNSLDYVSFMQKSRVNGPGDEAVNEAEASDKKGKYFAAKHKAEVAYVQFCAQAKLKLGIPE